MTDMHFLLRQRLPALLQTIAGPDPAGASLLNAPQLALLREARREDDSTLPMDIWATELKRGDWPGIESMASDLLSRCSKDLMVAIWLGESWARQYQLPGLCVALELLNGLCEDYGHLLYPRPQDDDASWLPPPLSWMVRNYSELLKIHLPLMGMSARRLEKLTYEQWMQAQLQALNKSEERRAKAQSLEAQNLLREWRELILEMPRNELVAQLQQIRDCLDSVEGLSVWSDSLLGEQSPSFAPLQNTLNQHVQALQEIIAMHPQPIAVAACPPAGDAPTTAEQTLNLEAPPFALATPDSREAAYRQLKVIAQYLAQVEPHSPVPYLINRAVDWGEMSLHELLGELINADVDTRRVWAVLGVLPG